MTPGRYFALYAGEVEAVQSATLRAIEVGGESVLDQLVLPSPHKSLVARHQGEGLARAARGGRDHRDAHDVLADRRRGRRGEDAARCGSTRSGSRWASAARRSSCISGEVSNVEAAVERGSALAAERGYLLSSVVIPRPDPAALEFLAKPASPFRDFEM